jgi:hypothetical protein
MKNFDTKDLIKLIYKGKTNFFFNIFFPLYLFKPYLLSTILSFVTLYYIYLTVTIFNFVVILFISIDVYYTIKYWNKLLLNFY